MKSLQRLVAKVVPTLGLVVAVAFAGCSDDGGSTEPVDNTPTEGDPNEGEPGEGEVTDDPVAQPLSVLGRDARRLTVQQLAQSIPVLTGGIEWVEDFGQGPVNMLELLGGALGDPDYLLVTTESLEPNLMIAKFVEDAAGRICLDWVDAEFQRAESERTMIQHADTGSLEQSDIRGTIDWLQLRFFGRMPADDNPTTDALYSLFESASSAAAPGQAARDGWLAVCLAVMTDPGFIVY